MKIEIPLADWRHKYNKTPKSLDSRDIFRQRGEAKKVETGLLDGGILGKMIPTCGGPDWYDVPEICMHFAY
jgi:hypothetical protein